MPLGNGDIAAGVYAIENDALYLLLSKNDAFTYNGDIFKTGRFHNFNATPAFYKDRAYLYIQPGLEQAWGESRWHPGYIVWMPLRLTFPDGGGLSAPVIANGRVYIGSGNTPLFYCLDAYTGEPYWIYKLGQRVEEATPCIYRDKVYVLSGDGYVHAIE